jgi:hypothetical protein
MLRMALAGRGRAVGHASGEHLVLVHQHDP